MQYINKQNSFVLRVNVQTSIKNAAHAQRCNRQNSTTALKRQFIDCCECLRDGIKPCIAPKPEMEQRWISILGVCRARKLLDGS